jgi:hypothetical protein
LIARNGAELEILKHKGDRDYYQFTLVRGQKQQVGTGSLELKKGLPGNFAGEPAGCAEGAQAEIVHRCAAISCKEADEEFAASSGSPRIPMDPVVPAVPSLKTRGNPAAEELNGGFGLLSATEPIVRSSEKQTVAVENLEAVLIFDTDALESCRVTLAGIPRVHPIECVRLLVASLEPEDQKLIVQRGRF